MPGRRRRRWRPHRRVRCRAGGGKGGAACGETMRSRRPQLRRCISWGPPPTPCSRWTPTLDGGDPVRIPRGRSAAPPRLTCDNNKSFVPMRRGGGNAWVVGVGGSSADIDYGPETIVFDAETHAMFPGLNPGSTKRRPVLLAIGDRIYALTWAPSVNGSVNYNDYGIDGRIDFLPCPGSRSPAAAAANGGPCRGRPFPPGNSPRTSTGGAQTTELWTAVDIKNSLPFRNGAAPHGPDLFLGLSRGSLCCEELVDRQQRDIPVPRN